MSTNAPALPAGITAEQFAQAQNQIFEQIEVPAWMNKLAEFGIEPKSQDEFWELLQLGTQMKQVSDNHPALVAGYAILNQKQAAAASPLQNLVRAGQAALQQPVQAAASPVDSLTKAAELAQANPQLAAAAVLFRTVLGQQAEQPAAPAAA